MYMKRKWLRDMMFILIISFIFAMCFGLTATGKGTEEPEDEGVYYNAVEEPEEMPEILVMPEGVPDTFDWASAELSVIHDEPEELPTEEYISLGEFEVTAYSLAEGSGCGLTKSGTVPQLNYTIAVDTDIIPLGTVLIINGIDYVAEDIGGLVKGKVVDIYMEDTQTALEYGRQVHEVFMKKCP